MNWAIFDCWYFNLVFICSVRNVIRIYYVKTNNKLERFFYHIIINVVIASCLFRHSGCWPHDVYVLWTWYGNGTICVRRIALVTCLIICQLLQYRLLITLWRLTNVITILIPIFQSFKILHFGLLPNWSMA